MKVVKGDGANPDKLVLEGTTDKFVYNLTVTQSWKALSSGAKTFGPMHGDDVGAMFPGEEWNVNMLWPRTQVSGWVRRVDTNEQIPVQGHGYRENSWGRWAFNMGGWDFAVVSDAAARVSWAWQTYHFKSTALDYVDVGFVDGNELNLIQFPAAQVGWSHAAWTFHQEARQCVPLDTKVVARNDAYRIEAKVTLAQRQVPMLSDATSATKQYVIMIQFPWVEGTIQRADGSIVTTFAGQGGGEFSTSRATVDSMTDEECTTWGQKFSAPMP